MLEDASLFCDLNTSHANEEIVHDYYQELTIFTASRYTGYLIDVNQKFNYQC